MEASFNGIDSQDTLSTQDPRSGGIFPIIFVHNVMISGQACAAGRRMDLALGQASAQQDQANTAKADLHSNNKAMQRLSVGLRRWCQAINHTKVKFLQCYLSSDNNLGQCYVCTLQT